MSQEKDEDEQDMSIIETNDEQDMSLMENNNKSEGLRDKNNSEELENNQEYFKTAREKETQQRRQHFEIFEGENYGRGKRE